MSYIFFNFIIYSFIGWVIEEIYCFSIKGNFKEDGFLIGPFKPMYGITASILIVLQQYFYENTFVMVLFCFFIPSIIEYLSGYLLKYLFNKIYWDYSKLKYNLYGLVSLKFSIYWTLMTFLGLKYIEPIIHNIFVKNEMIFLGTTIVLLIYLNIDCYLTVYKLLKRKSLKNI